MPRSIASTIRFDRFSTGCEKLIQFTTATSQHRLCTGFYGLPTPVEKPMSPQIGLNFAALIPDNK